MANDLSNEPRKLVLFGPPNSGKSSILLNVFGGVEPELILTSPIEPTRGIETSVYRWGHVDIGVFDLSGQEMEIFLGQERKFVFPDTDLLLLVFHYGIAAEKILKLIKMMAPIIRSYDIPETYILVHKIDKAPTKNEAEVYLMQVQKILDDAFGLNKLKVFGTSLYPEFYAKFKFQINWILSGLEISLEDMKELQEVPVSESLLKSLRTSGFIQVNLEDDALAEVPEPDPNGFNEMSVIHHDKEIKEVDRRDE